MKSNVRGLVAGILVAATVVSGCSTAGGGATPPSPSANPTTPLPSAPSSTSSGSGQQSDLTFPLPVRRQVQAGSVTLNVSYSSSLPANEWRSGAIKPIRVVVSAYNPRNRGQDVYLQRLMVTATPRDPSGPTEAAKQSVDASEINPGYYFRSPTTYNQIFVFPAVDSDPTLMSFKLTYEILVKIRAPRDYAKQTGEDTLTIPLNLR